MSSFYVSHNGEQSGPWTLEDIAGKVNRNEFTLMDYVYDEEKQDWMTLMEFAPLAIKLQDQKPKSAPPPLKGTKQHQPIDIPINDDTHREWYILKGENKFGPFAYTDVVRMLQQKAVYEFDFAWYPGLQAWKRIAEFEDFSPGKIKGLKETSMREIEEVFFRRRHRRVVYGGTILVHDNKTVWKGKGVEISAGGAGVIMENAMVVPGQTLYLHFKPGDGVPPFNAICEVVNKRFVDGVREKNAPIRYGLKFVNISQSTQKFLHDFTNRKAEAA